jgi:lactam utilization protein B
VALVRRYQKDFVDGDGSDACSLLTAEGKKQMITGGRGKTCAESVKRVLDQARDSDIELIKSTRAEIRVSDVKIHGDEATLSIGKGQRLRLARQGGRWFVDDPSP